MLLSLPPSLQHPLGAPPKGLNPRLPLPLVAVSYETGNSDMSAWEYRRNMLTSSYTPTIGFLNRINGLIGYTRSSSTTEAVLPTSGRTYSPATSDILIHALFSIEFCGTNASNYSFGIGFPSAGTHRKLGFAVDTNGVRGVVEEGGTTVYCGGAIPKASAEFRLHSVALLAKQSIFYFFHNGVYRGSVSRAVAWTYLMNCAGRVFVYNASGTEPDVFIHQYAAWDNAGATWDMAEQVSRYPMSMWEPRDQYRHAAFAASGLPTLSASTYVPGSLTSTGWRPRVTATY